MAQQKEGSRAERLFREAREDMKRQEYATACTKFAESLDLEARPGTLLNLSVCEEKRGHLVESLRHQRAAIAKLPEGDERAAAAKEREEDLERRVPLLTVKLRSGTPQEMRVALDATVISPEQIGNPISVNPGSHILRIAIRPGQMRSSNVTIDEAERKEIVLDPPRSDPQRNDEEQRGGEPLRTWGYVVGGLGVVGLAIGTGFAISAKRQDDDARKEPHYYPDTGTGSFCDQTCASKNQDARSSVTIGYGALGAGAALVGAGLAMIFLAPSSNRDSPKVSVRPAAGPGVAGLQMGGAW